MAWYCISELRIKNKLFSRLFGEVVIHATLGPCSDQGPWKEHPQGTWKGLYFTYNPMEIDYALQSIEYDLRCGDRYLYLSLPREAKAFPELIEKISERANRVSFF